MRRVFPLSLVVLSGLLGCVPARVAAAAGTPATPGQYYLALGDSLTYGFQLQKYLSEAHAGNLSESSFNTGAASDFYQMLRAVQPGIKLVNFACPGETTTSFMQASGCPSMPAGLTLHNTYSGSQLAAALAFLKAHPGQVNPITLNLGSNDIVHLVSACGGLGNLTCVTQKLPSTVETVLANLTAIVAQLHAAAPGAQIIVFNFFNPYAAASPATNALAQGVNSELTTAMQAAGAAVADVYTPINGTTSTATFCALDNFCSPLQDIHLSDAGYLLMARAAWDAAGYNALPGGFLVTYSSAAPGHGEVYFGPGPGCSGLVEVATVDRGTAQTVHIIWVNGNDMPGTVGNAAIVAGQSYSYQTVTVTSGGIEIGNNNGACFAVTAGMAAAASHAPMIPAVSSVSSPSGAIP